MRHQSRLVGTTNYRAILRHFIIYEALVICDNISAFLKTILTDVLFKHVYHAENHSHLKYMKLIFKTSTTFSILRFVNGTSLRHYTALFASVPLTIWLTIWLTGCASWLPEPHKLDLQQGNTIKLEQLESIEIGMTKSEVRKIMGSPMLSDPFHPQRWDYIYRFIPNKGFERKSLLTLYFEDEMLVRIDDSEYVEP